MLQRTWIAAAVVVVVVLALALVAVAQPSDRIDGTGRAAGYWAAYEKSQAPYAPYTVNKTDGTGRPTGYWQAYEQAYGRR